MNYKEQMLGLWDAYADIMGGEALSTMDFAQWAVRGGQWHPKPQEVVKRCAADMADALRDELRIDEFGIIYRGKICVRTSESGVQLTLWQDSDLAAPTFVEKSFHQRRRGVADVCFQLKSDYDHFNLTRNPEIKLQLSLDFTDDVAEREALERLEAKKNSG